MPLLIVETGEQAHIVKRVSYRLLLRKVIEHLRFSQLLAQHIELGLIYALDDEHVDGEAADLLVSVRRDVEEILGVLGLVEQIQVLAVLPVDLDVCSLVKAR